MKLYIKPGNLWKTDKEGEEPQILTGRNEPGALTANSMDLTGEYKIATNGPTHASDKKSDQFSKSTNCHNTTLKLLKKLNS